MRVSWYNFGAILLFLAVAAGAIGLREVTMYLSLASVFCVMLDLVVG